VREAFEKAEEEMDKKTEEEKDADGGKWRDTGLVLGVITRRYRG
jgi:hypothetical protein